MGLTLSGTLSLGPSASAWAALAANRIASSSRRMSESLVNEQWSGHGPSIIAIASHAFTPDQLPCSRTELRSHKFADVRNLGNRTAGRYLPECPNRQPLPEPRSFRDQVPRNHRKSLRYAWDSHHPHRRFQRDDCSLRYDPRKILKKPYVPNRN